MDIERYMSNIPYEMRQEEIERNETLRKAIDERDFKDEWDRKAKLEEA